MTAPVLNAAQGNKYLAKMIDGLPGYNEALCVAEQAQQALDGLAPVPDVGAELNPFASGKLTDAWIDAKLNHAADTARIEQRRNIVLELGRDARGRARGIYIGAADTLLAGLHAELTALLKTAADIVEQLDGAATADEAVTADAGAAWKQLCELAGDYQLLRDAQGRVMLDSAVNHLQSARPSEGGEDHASDCYLRNLDQLWPTWRTPGQGKQVFNLDGRQHRYEPWPVDDGPQLLLWLVESSAEAWIPTKAELDELWSERRTRANPNPKRVRRPSTVINAALPPKRSRVVSPIENLEEAVAE